MEHDNENGISITSEVIQNLGKIQFQCESTGDDFDVQLDSWANTYAANLAELGIQYPEDASVQDKCRILTTAAVNHILRASLRYVDSCIERIQEAGDFTPRDAGLLTKLQIKLNAEGEKSPHHRLLIEQVRTKIKELRDLIISR